MLTDSVGKRVGSRMLSASRFFEFPGLQAGAYTVTAASGAMTEHWEDVSTPVALECSGTQQRVHVAAAFKAQPRSRTKEVPTASFWSLLLVCLVGGVYSQRHWVRVRVCACVVVRVHPECCLRCVHDDGVAVVNVSLTL